MYVCFGFFCCERALRRYLDRCSRVQWVLWGFGSLVNRDDCECGVEMYEGFGVHSDVCVAHMICNYPLKG